MTTSHDAVGNAPTPDEIAAAIDRITTSDVFNRSPQLGAFLRYVVEAVLQGKASRIKAYTIGLEVLHRDPSFDPQIDPIVRVEATRLRRTIERYYAGSGIDDPIVVDLPRGAYVPTFRRRETDGVADTARPRRLGMLLSRPGLPALAAVALVVFAGIGVHHVAPLRPDAAATIVRDVTSRVASQTLPAGNGMPSIFIEPLRVIGDLSESGLDPGVLLHKIGDAFARFDTVNVVHAPLVTLAAAGDTPAEPRADYRLSGELEYRDGQTSAYFRLIDTTESNVVWVRSFDRIVPGGKGRAEGEIVGALTEALLQSYGVVRSRDRTKHLASNAGDPRYRCILKTADSFRTLRLAEHERARACLEDLTAADPSFAVGYAFLALIYSREYQHGIGMRPGDPPPLDRALRAVRRSLELNPASSRAHVVLMVVLFHRRELAEAFAAGEKAIALNKYDMLGLAEYGGRLILTGEADKGLAMLRRASQFGVIRPAWQHFYMFMGAYLSGDLKEAAYQAGQITAENYSSGHLARALLAVAAGDIERARQAADRLVALQPGWRSEPGRELAKLSPSPQVTRQIADDLAKAGISGH